MCECLLSCNSLSWLLLEHHHQKIQGLYSCFLIFLAAEINIGSPILRKHLVVSSSRKCTFPVKKYVENESQTVHIAYCRIFSFHILNVDDLWSHIAWCSTTNKQVTFDVRELSETEISDNAIPLPFLSEQQILGFEISVHNTFRVHLPQTAQDTAHDGFSLLRFEFVF